MFKIPVKTKVKKPLKTKVLIHKNIKYVYYHGNQVGYIRMPCNIKCRSCDITHNGKCDHRLLAILTEDTK